MRKLFQPPPHYSIRNAAKNVSHRLESNEIFVEKKVLLKTLKMHICKFINEGYDIDSAYAKASTDVFDYFACEIKLVPTGSKRILNPNAPEFIPSSSTITTFDEDKYINDFFSNYPSIDIIEYFTLLTETDTLTTEIEKV